MEFPPTHPSIQTLLFTKYSLETFATYDLCCAMYVFCSSECEYDNKKVTNVPALNKLSKSRLLRSKL